MYDSTFSNNGLRLYSAVECGIRSVRAPHEDMIDLPGIPIQFIDSGSITKPGSPAFLQHEAN